MSKTFFIYVYRERLISDFAEHKQGRPVYVGATIDLNQRHSLHLHGQLAFDSELRRRGADALYARSH